MPTSIRLDEETTRLLESTARRLKRARSAVLQEAVREYCARAAEREAYPVERAKHLIGAFQSDESDLSENTGARVRELLEARRRDRR